MDWILFVFVFFSFRNGICGPFTRTAVGFVCLSVERTKNKVGDVMHDLLINNIQFFDNYILIVLLNSIKVANTWSTNLTKYMYGFKGNTYKYRLGNVEECWVIHKSTPGINHSLKKLVQMNQEHFSFFISKPMCLPLLNSKKYSMYSKLNWGNS